MVAGNRRCIVACSGVRSAVRPHPIEAFLHWDCLRLGVVKQREGKVSERAIVQQVRGSRHLPLQRDAHALIQAALVCVEENLREGQPLIGVILGVLSMENRCCSFAALVNKLSC